MHSKYPPCISKIEDAWKQAPVSFESYWWLCEWQRQGWDIDEVIEKTLSWHLSSLNAKSIPVPYEWKDKVDAWVAKMGYHFAIDSFSHPESAAAGDCMNLELTIENVGVAPIYHRLPLQIRLSHGDQHFLFETDADITQWLPGKHQEKFSLSLPADLPAGEYAIEIGIDSAPYSPIYFCTDAPRHNAFYQVGEIFIQN